MATPRPRRHDLKLRLRRAARLVPALAAALLLPAGPAPACERAATVLHSMRIQLADCAVERVDVVVTATVPVRLGRWELGTARAAARAGPGP